jgi:hypothetical protein
MQIRRFVHKISVVPILFGLAAVPQAWAGDAATPEEIVVKVKEAAANLSKSGEAGLAEFNQKDGPWVWKDTYIFVYNCEAGVMSAHPIKATLVGKEILPLKDTKGNLFFSELCTAAAKPNGGWVEYWWPKPDKKEGSRKITYTIEVANTPYQVGAGVYDDSVSISELEKVSQ